MATLFKELATSVIDAVTVAEEKMKE